MKKYILKSCIFISIVLITSCDPDNKPIFNTEQVKLKANINNPNEIITINDTLKITLQLPDTITSNTGIYPVRSLQECSFPMHISLIDTINRRSVLQRPPTYWVTQGSITNNSFFSMNTQNKPYGVTINFKPTQKGIYYLEVTQPWNLKINNGYDARLYVNFDVVDKHYNLLNVIAPYFGGQSFYQALVDKDAQGFGVYFFKVN